MTLDEIAIKHGCDKSSLKHDYCRIYEDYICRTCRGRRVRLLEIGYGGYSDPDQGGESARMWIQYFGVPVNDFKLPDGFSVTITDIHPKNNVPEGVIFLQTDVTNPQLSVDHFYDSPSYDIIIDDGSHLNADIIAAFKNLWPVLNPGGLYCVEDTHSSYDPYYADSHHWPGAMGTAMQYFTFLAHSVNKDFIGPNAFLSADLLPDIEFIHFYKDLIIIKKKAA